MKDNANKFDAFKSAGLKEWEAAAREELNGANPWEKLAHKGEGWSSKPYYEQQTTAIAPQLLSNSGNEFLGARAWFNCPRIVVKDLEKSNQIALNFLQQGADGIFFELNGNINFNKLLEGIQLQYCSLSFLAMQDPIPTAGALQAFFREKKSDSTALPGAFFGNTVIESDQAHIFKFCGFQIPASANPVADIADGFLNMIKVSGRKFGAQINSIAFSVPVATDFFVEIAKLRAIRIVWKKLLNERGLTDEAKLFLHAVSLPWKTNNFEPHGNMLKSTTAAMASILGGCDALTIDPEDHLQAMQLRVARNVSNILREESFFSKVADPVAGSYFIEDLTNQIAEGAWKSIQQQ